MLLNLLEKILSSGEYFNENIELGHVIETSENRVAIINISFRHNIFVENNFKLLKIISGFFKYVFKS